MKQDVKLTPEQIEMANNAPSVDALITLAKENNIHLTEEEASIIFAKLHPESGELDDDALEAVCGGYFYMFDNNHNN